VRELHYIQLGATLFIPANHKHLYKILTRQKYPELKSVVIDFEDGFDRKKFQEVFVGLQELLASISHNSPFVFIRPRDIKMLEKLLHVRSINHIDGFVLPKFGLENGANYLALLQEYDFAIMPSIEGKELFNREALEEIKSLLLLHKKNILLVRFGLEDMFKMLTMRKKATQSVFDLSVTSYVLGQFLALFKGAGFAVSGGVYSCFLDDDGLLQDVQRDLLEGLFSKTIIHPRQIAIVHKAYKVTQEEYDTAFALCNASEVVFNLKGAMAETHTMIPYAQEILLRAKEYGIKH